MARGRLEALALIALVTTLAVGAAGACTAFNDVTVDADASTPRDGGVLPDTADTADEPTNPTTQAYLPPALGAKLCAAVFACPQLDVAILESIAVPIDSTNFALCMDWATGPIPLDRNGFAIQQQMLQCMAQAPGCGAAQACAIFENIFPGDPRCPGPNDGGDYCGEDGSAVVFCQTPTQVWHCDHGSYTPGATCRVGTDGFPWCGVSGPDGGCTMNDACRNGVNSFEQICLTDGIGATANCNTAGGVCGIDGGFAACGPPCIALTTTCSGTSVQVCDAVELTSFDCAALGGGGCDSRGAAVHCTRPSDTCSPADPSMNQCTGTTISLCVGGQPASFDCASTGQKCLPGVVPQTAHCG